ncbi:MAG: type IV toxin-antitoxin system AbiEi family antitoxin [Victivallales bacterium]
MKATREIIAEDDLLKKAVGAFSCPDGMTLSIDSKRKSTKDVDAFVTFKQREGSAITYRVEIKSSLHSAVLLPLRDKFQDTQIPRILITSYISPGVAESLKKMKVQFMDTLGNAYVEAPGIYVYVNRHTKPAWMVKEKSLSLFHSSGVKVIFVCLGETVNKAYAGNSEGITGNLKFLANIAGVSLGRASHIRNELIAQGYLVASSKTGFELQNREKLLEGWIKAYAERLRPKLLIGKYQPVNPQWWKMAKLDPKAFLWGGEVAAAKLTGYLSPEIVTVYTSSGPNILINTEGLQPDEKGTVEIRSIFWNSEAFPNDGCVHPLLVYADLLASDDDRNIETAKLIYNRYLSNAFE